MFLGGPNDLFDSRIVQGHWCSYPQYRQLIFYCTPFQHFLNVYQKSPALFYIPRAI